MLKHDSVLAWTSIEHVLYEENGHEFVIEFDLFNNHKYFYHRKDGYYTELTRSTCEDIYDAIDKFNVILEESKHGSIKG